MGEPRANGAAAARGEGGAFDSNANQLCASFAQAAPNQRTKQKQIAYHLGDVPQCRMVSYAQLRKVGLYESREYPLLDGWRWDERTRRSRRHQVSEKGVDSPS